MNPLRAFCLETEKEIVGRYLKGERSGALANEYRCDRKMITNMVKRHGYSKQVSSCKGGISGIDTSGINEKIIELHSLGMSQKRIGDAVGLSQSVISRVFRQLVLTPNLNRSSPKGEKSPVWKGGRIRIEGGYVAVLTDEFPSMRTKMGYVLEHRLVMARYLRRPLEKWESVHHVNGIKDDNSIENLQLRIGNHGKGVVYCCDECGSYKVKPIEI